MCKQFSFVIYQYGIVGILLWFKILLDCVVKSNQTWSKQYYTTHYISNVDDNYDEHVRSM